MNAGADQSLSLRAALKDEITPQLKKINASIQQTQRALKDLEKALLATTKGVPGAATKMQQGTSKATKKMNEDLSESAQAFKTLEGTARKSSQQINQALQDSLYTQKTSKDFSDLDKSFDELKDTFTGIASTSRPASIKAGKVKAMGQDTLNKKVIPAFQDLHASLDEFPDTIEDIIAAQESQLKGSKEYATALGGVTKRVGGLGESLKRLKLDAEDFIGGVMATGTYAAADKLQTKQFEVGQIAGIDDALKFPEVWKAALKSTEAPIEVWEEALKTMQELTSASAEEMPALLGDFVKISKVTGISTKNLATMHDQLTNISGLKQGEFSKLFDNMNQMAKEGRISIDELSTALMNTADSMRELSKEGRAAYAEAMLAGSATLKEMGAEGVSDLTNLAEKLKTDKNAYMSVANLLQGELGVDAASFEKMFQNSEFDKIQNLTIAAMDKRFAGMSENYRAGQQISPFEREAMQAGMPGFDVNSLLGVTRDSASTLAEQYNDPSLATMDPYQRAMRVTEIQRQRSQGAGQAMGEQEGFLRNLIPQQRERGESVAEQMSVRVGEAGAPVIQNAQGKLLDFAKSGMEKFAKWDDKYNQMFSKAMAYYGLSSPVKTFLKNATQFIPFVGDKLSSSIDSGFGSLLATGGIIWGLKKFLGGDSEQSVSGIGTAGAATTGYAGSSALGEGGAAPGQIVSSVTTARFSPFEQAAAPKEIPRMEFPASSSPAVNPFEAEAARSAQPGLFSVAKAVNPIEAAAGAGAIPATTINPFQADASKGFDPNGALSLVVRDLADKIQNIPSSMPNQERATMTGWRPAYEGQPAPKMPKFEPEGPSIMKAIDHRVDEIKSTLKLVGTTTLDFLIPFRKEAMAGLKSFIRSNVEVSKKVIAGAAKGMKDFGAATVTASKSVLVGLIAGDMNEAQRQKQEQISQHLDQQKQIVERANPDESPVEINNRLSEAALEQQRQLLEVTKQMKGSMDSIAKEGERKERTQGLRPAYVPAGTVQERYISSE